MVYFPSFIAIRCCVTSDMDGVNTSYISLVLTIRIADLTGINISIFVYFHIPLVSRTDLAKNMYKIKVNVSVSASITTTGPPEYDACQRTLVSAS